MSGAATSRAEFATARHRIGPIARALVWEECRVGGVVAMVCAAVGAGLIVLVRVYIGPAGWESRDAILVPFVLFVPVLIALLLILNPANSGHLGGGFARRVLWLPVPTGVAVGISMGMRAVFVFAASALLAAVTGLLFDSGPGLVLPLAMVIIYLGVQTLDWLRGTLSGLTTAVAMGLLFAAIPLISYSPEIMATFLSSFERLGAMGYGILLIPAFAAAYGVSIAAVHATRAGRQYGVPEAWEWEGVADRLGFLHSRPFRSPVGAQIWFELRQYGWTLPAVTLLLPLILGVGPWLFAPSDEPSGLAKFSASMMFLTFALGAVAHGIRARALGIRTNPGKLPFAYGMPLSPGEMGLAKSLAAWIVILPTTMFVLVYQIAVFAPAFITEVIPYAWSEGMTSAREVVWALGSRGILFALGAWLLVGLGTRTVRRMMVPLAAALFLSLFWELYESESWQPGTLMASAAKAFFQTDTVTGAHMSHLVEFGISWAIMLLIAGTALGALTRAWRLGLVSRRILAGWVAAWALVAVLFAAQLPESSETAPRLLVDYVHEALISLAWASIVPLVFAAFVLDIDRRRHGTAVRQNAKPLPTRGRMGYASWAMGGAAAIVVLWLAWPAEPAYHGYLRAQGLPANEAEFLAAYRTVPPEENISRHYDKLIHERNHLNQARHERWRDSGSYDNSQVFLFGETEWPLTDIQREATLQYWDEVTSKVAPTLVDLAEQLDGRRPGGYYNSLNPFDSFDINRSTGLVNLMREASLDAYYWSLQGDSARTADAIIAIIGVSDSMADDWDSWYASSRGTFLWAATSSLERSLKSVEFTDVDLDRIAHRFDSAWNPEDVASNSLRYQQFVSLRALEFIAFDMPPGIVDEQISAGRWMLLSPAAPLYPLAFSPSAERMVTVTYFTERIDEVSSREHLPMSKRGYSPRRLDSSADLGFVSFFSSMYLTIFGFLELSTTEYAVRIDTARVGMAAERYRMAHGQWPETLNELVPAYLDAVPTDQLAAEPGIPLRMTIRDDSFVAYSAGRSGEDHGGFARGETEERKTDDITFVVGRGRE